MSAAERKRLHRERQREGRVVLTIAVKESALKTFERYHVIDGTTCKRELEKEAEELLDRLGEMIEYRQMMGLWNAVPKRGVGEGECQHGNGSDGDEAANAGDSANEPSS